MTNQTKITPRTLKGFRDFLPDQAEKRRWLRNELEEIFLSFGFRPLETPALEYLETFAGQVGEDEKLFYQFEDQGGRKVALRYDQTVPTCRVIAQYQNEINLPFKRFQIQPVWRAEKPQKGRYREFVQCDADIFGIESAEADAEIILLSLEIYRRLGFKQATVIVNDRELFAQADIPYPVISAVDKLDKIGREGVIKELIAKGYKPKQAEELLQTILSFKPTKRIETIFETLKNAGYDESWYKFEPTLARSFSYSSGPIWEVVIPGFKGSVLGGERFDKLVSTFTKREIPATGFGLGFDRTLEALEEKGLLPKNLDQAQVLVAVFSPETKAAGTSLALKLRSEGLRVEVTTDSTKRLPNQIRYADRKNIPFLLILGENELKDNVLTLKNLETGDQQTGQTEEILLSLKKELALDGE